MSTTRVNGTPPPPSSYFCYFRQARSSRIAKLALATCLGIAMGSAPVLAMQAEQDPGSGQNKGTQEERTASTLSPTWQMAIGGIAGIFSCSIFLGILDGERKEEIGGPVDSDVDSDVESDGEMTPLGKAACAIFASVVCVQILFGLCYYLYYYFYPPEKEEPNQKEKKKTPLKTESEKSSSEGEENTDPGKPKPSENTHSQIGEPSKRSDSGGEGSGTGPGTSPAPGAAGEKSDQNKDTKEEKPPKEEKYTPLSIEPESKAKDSPLLKILFVLLLLVLAGGGIYWARKRR